MGLMSLSTSLPITRSIAELRDDICLTKMTLNADDYKDFEISGFDIDITQTGSR